LYIISVFLTVMLHINASRLEEADRGACIMFLGLSLLFLILGVGPPGVLVDAEEEASTVGLEADFSFICEKTS
jgi:hypothetical protein